MVTGTDRTWTDRAAVLLASFGLAGFFPVAPATFASAVAAAVLAVVYPLRSPAAYAALCVAILLVGAWAAGRLERFYGKDPSAAVIDEVLGMAVALAGAPITPATLAIAFLLFRCFDVVKLPPVRWLERLPGGWGIMADDACAGLYAAILLQVTLRLWPEPQLALWQLVPLGVAAVVLLVFRRPLVRRYGKKRCDVRTGLQGGEGR